MDKTLRQGRLVTWKDEKGFGFIQPADNGQEVFLHISEIKDSTRRPQTGDTIYYRTTTQDGKIRACNAFIAGARVRSAAAGDPRNASLPLRQLLGLLVIPLLGAIVCLVQANYIGLLFGLAYPVVSWLTFQTYKYDKQQAQAGEWRVSEEQLHMLELLGGWPGGLIAQHQIRHKSRKQTYQAAFWTIVSLHQIGWMVWIGVGLLS